METLPIRHLSARVPWHDNKWNGTFCCDVLNNSFCRILSRIDAEKDPNRERDGELINQDYLPPCVPEKGTFLSPHEFVRPLKHAWSDYNVLYKEYLPGDYHHKVYSFNAVPFAWMMKAKATVSDWEKARDPSIFEHRSAKAQQFELAYDPELEEVVDEKLGFDGNTWVQHPQNQQLLLDSFFGALQERRSLIFFYAKETPLSESNERVIIGVAKVKHVGPLQHYKFKPNYKGYRSYPWDRCVEHTLTPNLKDGFLMPYHELLEYNANGELDPHDFVAVATSFEEFSYASELVEHDTAIDCLLNMAEALKKSAVVLNKSFEKELKWIDTEISNLWDMRGPFPGMGAMLSALKMANGNTLAWEIEKFVEERDGDLFTTNPWTIFEESIAEPGRYLAEKGTRYFTTTLKMIWKSVPGRKKALVQLMSRMRLNNDQAVTLFKNYHEMVGALDNVLANPYLLYEKTRYRYPGLISFNQLDKAVLPPPRIADVFPLPEPSALDSQLDERRMRAITVWVLEEAAAQGHSLLPFGDALERLEGKILDEEFPINEDLLMAYAEEVFFQQEIVVVTDGQQQFLKLKRLAEVKELIANRINKDRITSKSYEINENWKELVDDFINEEQKIKESPSEHEEAARLEKSEALRILVNYKVSVLIGPAGSGKTTLLKLFETLPEIRRGGVLKLAPTGKARVKLGADAKTIAQYLYPDRYDATTGVYFNNEMAAKYAGARNVIIDEASMLTEEQLAAIFDALGSFDRLILVGDFRQLPPIGTGRPFVDVTELLRPDTYEDERYKIGPAYAELCRILRQSPVGDEERVDVQLSRCFGNEPAKDDLALFNTLTAQPINNPYIRLEKWYASTDFRELLIKVISEELNLGQDDVAKEFNRRIGAVDDGGYQYFNVDRAEREIEKWQIITPINGYGFGTKEINKQVQQTYRRYFIDLALRPYNRKVAKPKGVDNMVYGDKVINLRNSRWEDWQGIYPKEKKATALNYFANGEIGSIVGKFKGASMNNQGEMNVEIAFSTQPGYSYIFWPGQFSEESRKSYKFELAYAITVHKAQGSGFEKVFFVLPAKGAGLSRELLYTALTRQEKKIIILHQGAFRDFIRLAGTDASSTARRFTDLFFLPEARLFQKKWYDAKYINISERGEPMISKNEVIIANSLFKYRGTIDYTYEDKLKLESSGRTIKPDFTIENLVTGRKIYWEHLGMMTKTNYREKWELKKAGYLADGFVLHAQAKPSDEKVLIITEENPNGGIDSQYFDQLIQQVILEH